MKFETFPVFTLPENHPLNLAFEAATADLRNKVVGLEQGITSYDKDIDNFPLLQGLYRSQNIHRTHPIMRMENPTEMGINVIETGILNMDEVIRASGIEILRRYQRYAREFERGDEKPETLARTLLILRQYAALYPNILPENSIPVHVL